MALKSTYAAEEKGAEIEEALDALDKLVDRVKVLYEQYFMGIQKQAPAHLHTETERRIRDLTQMQIRNTALRYRFATIQQKYGAYNTYWKRTLREIEAGRYVRNLARIRQKALATGEEIPEELVAKMPKRMREAIARDRAAAVAQAAREGKLKDEPAEIAELDQGSDTVPDAPRFAPPPNPRAGRSTQGPHRIDDPFADDSDLSAALAAMADEALAAVEPRKPAAAARPGPPPPPPPPASARGTPPPLPPRAATAGPPPVRAATSPPVAPRATTAAPVPSPIPGMSEADTRALYAKYVKARAVVGDRTDPMSYDKLVRTLSTQAPKILAQHKASGVEFNVVIKDNKVVLKARPK